MKQLAVLLVLLTACGADRKHCRAEIEKWGGEVMARRSVCTYGPRLLPDSIIINVESR